MDSKKVSILVSYFTLLLAIIAIIAVVVQKPKTLSAANIEPQNNVANVNDNRILFWELYPELVLPNEGKILDKNLILVDTSDRELTLQDLNSDDHVLFFRFSQFDCSLCIDQVLGKLHTVFKDQESKVNLLIDGMTARDYRIKYKDRNILLPAYLIREKNLDLSLENKNMPFLFILDKSNYSISKIFLPYEELPLQTDAYLKAIKKFLNE